MKAIILVLTLAGALIAGHFLFGRASESGPVAPPEMARVERYFDTPAQSARQIARLVRERDWARLATYADFSAYTPERFAALLHDFARGRYEQVAPAMQVTAPGASYHFHRALADNDYTVVYVARSAETQADPARLDSYVLRLTPQGYQLLLNPDAAPRLVLSQSRPD